MDGKPVSGTLNEFCERSCRVNCSHFQSAREFNGEGTFSAETLRRRLTFRSLDRESWSCSEGFTDPFEFIVHDNRDDQSNSGVADPSELYSSKSLCPFVARCTSDPCRNIYFQGYFSLDSFKFYLQSFHWYYGLNCLMMVHIVHCSISTQHSGSFRRDADLIAHPHECHTSPI